MPIFRKSTPGTRSAQGLRISVAWLVRSLGVLAMSTLVAASGNAETAPNIPRINLTSALLHAEPVADKPTMVLALSVEFPTAGAQYYSGRNPDNSYSNTSEYLGYYDANGCYKYNNNPTDTGMTAAQAAAGDFKRFQRTGSTENRKCADDAFSGNFLNWSSSSTIDMLRLALSGGDRVIDRENLTVLQRAVMPHDPCMWNKPAKLLEANGGDYFGAVPRSMRQGAAGAGIYIANVSNKIYFGLIFGGHCRDTGHHRLGSTAASGSLNSDGFFYARVEVCNVSSGTLQDNRDYNFCKLYPSGHYKPAGMIQRYADQMRYAAFGYLMDPSSSAEGGRYGGVLRAPMKYVGAKTYDTDGRENTPVSGNPGAEWDARTGQFKDNPDGISAVPGRWPAVNGWPVLSGVINYLNRFGRTGPTPGMYKYADPVGELHSEALRYLQGLQPRPESISNVSNAMADGFPYFSEWSDPYGGRPNTGDYSCAKSHIVVIGDYWTHDSSRLLSPDAANNIPDINYWRGVVENFERKSGLQQSLANPENPSRDVAGFTRALGHTRIPYTRRSMIMGTAYWARTHDIRGTGWTAQPGKQRPGLRVKTIVFDVNQLAEENIREYRYNSHLFLAAKYGGFETDPRSGKPYNSDGNPFKNQQNNTFDNNVWQKASNPGEASSYYINDTTKPSPAREVLGAFDDIFSRIVVSAHNLSPAGLSTGSKLSSNSMSYSTKFDTKNWTGDVEARPITQNASHELGFGEPRWRAAERLDSMQSPAVRRKIFIGQASATANPAAVEFKWDKLSTALQAQLSSEKVAYLRGDKSNESERNLRIRSSLLGDIINSNVSYSGTPSKVFTDPAYKAFRAEYDARTHAVFAGANDGMLHAFNAETGDEMFAYIPGWLGPELHRLTDKDYANNHRSYVDAPSVVAEVQVENTGQATDWKTVLVSGTGGGGSGVFALDVSNPAAFNASKAMWEFTRADDPDIGQVIGAPKIMKVKTSGTNATASYRWFAVVASGVNNYVPESSNSNRFSSTGKPALFLLALDKPVGTAWSEGQNYFKVSVPINTTGLATTPATGLVNFSALYGHQGEMTDIYMGDLHGALWRLQFEGKPTADWTMDKLSFFKNGTAAYPLYRARTGDADPKVQPIVAAPTLFVGPVVDGKKSFHVAFGTGKYLEAEDQLSTTRQSLYVIYDNGSPDADTDLPGASVIAGRGRLQRGTVGTDKKITVNAFRWGRPRSDDASGTPPLRAGWYFDLPGTGERIDQAGLNLGSLTAVFNSKIPPAAAAGCATGSTRGGGNQYVLYIDQRDAGRYTAFDTGILDAPVFVTNDEETQYMPSGRPGMRKRITKWRDLSQTHSGGPGGLSVEDLVGRMNWRQIFDYQNTRNATP